jgi:hypothetical protein
LATTPDFYSATLVLFSCATLARKHVSLRTLGVLALGIASLSRYEAWPVAVLWAFLNGVDAVRSRRWQFAWLAAIGLVPPALWMLHGANAHNSALFFVERVASYQHALGSATPHGLTQAFRTPWRLIADAPEIWALLLFAALCGKGPRLWPKRWNRPVCAISTTVLFVWSADWHGSTATHHSSRTLLAAWFMLAALAAANLFRRSQSAGAWQRARFVLGAAGTGALAMFALRPAISSIEPPQDRSEEVQFGLLASHRVPKGARLAIATPGYGYFAAEAAFARPLETRVVNPHDPRRPAADPFLSSNEASRTLRDVQADWVIAERNHERVLSEFATILDRGPSLLFARAR